MCRLLPAYFPGGVCVSALVKARGLRLALEWIFWLEDQVLVVPGKGEKETENDRDRF